MVHDLFWTTICTVVTFYYNSKQCDGQIYSVYRVEICCFLSVLWDVQLGISEISFGLFGAVDEACDTVCI